MEMRGNTSTTDSLNRLAALAIDESSSGGV